ncbi:MAG: hypothetical protein KC431_11710, partial [Myxococcales bacterium]|nr:hypothetical protein [Myxococcales bacterium]
AEARLEEVDRIGREAEDEAALLGGRLVQLLVPEQNYAAISLAAIEVLRPTTVVPTLEDDPAPAVAALRELLAPRYAQLGAPLASDNFEVGLEVGTAVMQRVRWQKAGTLIEAAYAPAGPFTALVLVRGAALESHRTHFEALLQRLRGLGRGELPPLPTLDLAGMPHPLELLGAALDLRRLPWEVDVETYRNRVRILAPMLSEGLATPRVIVAATLTSLHSEPCPILERPEPDSTRGYGLPPRTLDRCQVCQGGRRRPLAGEQCPMRARAQNEATVTDNPRTRARLTRSRLDPMAEPAGARLRIYSNSLFAARPQIVLRVPADADPATMLVPRFRSLTTGEELVVPTALLPGDELTLRPGSDWQPERPLHRQIWVDPPSGEHLLPARAWILRAASSTLEVVDTLIMYAVGPRFGKARFADVEDAAEFEAAHFDSASFDEPEPDANLEPDHFAQAELGVQAPALRPGDNTWLFSTLASDELESLIGDYQLPPEFDIDDFAAATTPVSLELSWWTRPPARFRIRIPRKPAVEQLLAQGAASSLRRLVDRVRPAGVFPIIDFAVEPILEIVDPEIARRSLGVRGHDALEPGAGLDQVVVAGQGEVVDPEDRMAVYGVFDGTPFDISLFNERQPLADPAHQVDDVAREVDDEVVRAQSRSQTDELILAELPTGVAGGAGPGGGGGLLVGEQPALGLLEGEDRREVRADVAPIAGPVGDVGVKPLAVAHDLVRDLGHAARGVASGELAEQRAEVVAPRQQADQRRRELLDQRQALVEQVLGEFAEALEAGVVQGLDLGRAQAEARGEGLGPVAELVEGTGGDAELGDGPLEARGVDAVVHGQWRAGLAGRPRIERAVRMSASSSAKSSG